MRVIDPGHIYALQLLDALQMPGADQETRLTFVKREGEGYPGNVGHHEGTNLQEVLRACLDRLRYVNYQIRSEYSIDAMFHIREAIYSLELRAAGRHKRVVNFSRDEAVSGPFCHKCGHVGCGGECH